MDKNTRLRLGTGVDKQALARDRGVENLLCSTLHYRAHNYTRRSLVQRCMPVNEPCNKMADPSCKPTYYSCADLNVTELRLAVGNFDQEVTTVPCPDDLQTGSSLVQVRYQPGANFYMIDASFQRDAMTVYIAAGPYPQNQAALPWEVLLR